MAADESLPIYITHNSKANKTFRQWRNIRANHEETKCISIRTDCVVLHLSYSQTDYVLEDYECMNILLDTYLHAELKNHKVGENSRRVLSNAIATSNFYIALSINQLIFWAFPDGVMLSLMSSQLRSTRLQFVCRVIVSVCFWLVLVQC